MPVSATHAIAGVDHGVVGVGDLEAARRRFAAFGFTITPRGRHIGWATANYCIMFAHDYIELLGVLDSAGYSAGLSEILEQRGEGLLKLALRSDDAERTHAFLAEAGLVAGPIQDLAREIELPGGTLTPAFRLIHPLPEAMPGLAGFICEHKTPDLVWQSAWLRHRNTAVAVASYTILASDPPALAAGWARLFGRPAVTAAAGHVSVETGTARLDFARPAALPRLYPQVAIPLQRAGTIVGLTVRVESLQAAAACLEAAGIGFVRDGARRFVVTPGEACGVALAFEPAG